MFAFGDTQVARFADGQIRSINCVRSEDDGQRFQAIMTRQGFSVAHYTREEWAEHLGRPKPCQVVEPAAPLPAPPAPVPSEPLAPELPPRYVALVARAKTNQLPSGTTFLASGLVTHLSEYVLAWSEAWPNDQQHVERRLDEALDYLRLLENA